MIHMAIGLLGNVEGGKRFTLVLDMRQTYVEYMQQAEPHRVEIRPYKKVRNGKLVVVQKN